MWRIIKNWFLGLFDSKSEERPDQAIEPVKIPVPDDGVNFNDKILSVCNELMNKVNEVPGSKHNPVIVEMLKTVSGKDYPDETPWCAAAVGYVLNRVGLPFKSSLMARSYTDYGRNISSISLARAGDILVFKRGNSSWQGHVGFYSGSRTDGYIEVIGGNQSNGFNKSMYETSDLLAIRRAEKAETFRQGTRTYFSKTDLGSLFYARLTELSYELSEYTPSDIGRYVAGYHKMEREQKAHFWSYFLSCMAMKESSITPNKDYRESFTVGFGPRKYERVISRGLFQLSFDSVNLYKSHGFKGLESMSDLHDPVINLEAAVFILKHWIKKDGSISSRISPWRGGARYWSVLRSTDAHRWIIAECNKWGKNYVK